jgi:hypothetical protein
MVRIKGDPDRHNIYELTKNKMKDKPLIKNRLNNNAHKTKR